MARDGWTMGVGGQERGLGCHAIIALTLRDRLPTVGRAVVGDGVPGSLEFTSHCGEVYLRDQLVFAHVFLLVSLFRAPVGLTSGVRQVS